MDKIKRKRSTLDLFTNIYPYFKKHRWILIIDLICAALTTVAEIVIPIIIRYITNLGIYNHSLITMQIVLRVAIIFIIIKTIDIISSYYMSSIGHIMGAKIETDMRKDIYMHLQQLSNSFYDKTKTGHIMSRITNDLFDVTEFSHHCPEEYFIGLLKIIVSFFILININIILTILIYIMIPLMIFGSFMFRRRMRKAQMNQRSQIGSINSSIEDSISGIRVVKSFANEEIEIDKFKVENNKFLGIKKDYYKSMAGFVSVNKFFDGLMYLMVIVVGAILIMNQRINAGDMVIYAMYVSTLIATVRRIVEFTEQFQKGMTGIERFIEIMEIDTDIYDDENAISVNKLDGVVEFDKVSFSYKKDDNKVLDDFSMVIDKGKNLAIVGPSGSGKTTICNLIPRFYDVDTGSIKIDGIDIKKIKLNDLRNNIGIVQQDVYLFSGTIKENILYGKPDADFEDVIEASKLAGAYDFIMELPDKFDTYVGERGLLLSGGQKQRISIARVFLKNPPILILDEATSALDNRSEQIVQESIAKLSEGRTTITIAHRLTTVQEADEIIVMTDEGIVERGNHKELMENKKYYYDLYTKGGMLSV